MNAQTVERIARTIARCLSDGWQPTYLDLQCELGCHPWTIARTLEQLERAGVLHIERRRGIRNRYQIVRNVW